MLLGAILGVLVAGVVTLGPGWPLAQRLALDPSERIVASVATSLVIAFLAGWTVYVLALPLGLLWLLPLLGAVGLLVGGRTLLVTCRDEAGRALLLGQPLVTVWCVGWLALTVSYSGGGWTGDWFGHWQRAQFFLDRGPRDVLFNGNDPVTARPPLANVVTGALLVITQRDFAHYQLAMTVLSSLAFLPAALLARRFSLRQASGGHVGGACAITIAAALIMVNPMMVQNATFAWTKLLTAFFVLTALYFFLRAHDADAPRAAGVLCATSLTAGILAHYSTAPYALILGVAWLAFGWPRRHEAGWWRTTGAAALAAALLLATWFGWALANYGVKGTFLTNTSVADKAPTVTAQLVVPALNVRDTLVPHFLRSVDYSLFAQTSPWGWWRDWFFQVYQVNLFFACGCVAWVALLVTSVRLGRRAPRSPRAFWMSLVVGTVILGVGAVGERDVWGLAHICLQPLVLLALALLAARWSSLSIAWRGALIAGATVDLALGVALQFGAQSFALDRWLTPGRPPEETLLSYSQFALMNLFTKQQNGWVFFGDGFTAHVPLILAMLAALLALALIRAKRCVRLRNPRAGF